MFWGVGPMHPYSICIGPPWAGSQTHSGGPPLHSPQNGYISHVPHSHHTCACAAEKLAGASLSREHTVAGPAPTKAS